MAEAPPAEQVMDRNRVAVDVGGDPKLDASELDGCWLILPDHHCKFCFDTSIHCQKHVDADTVVSKSAELALGHPCCPCGLASLLIWCCCPSTFLGLRARDANHVGKNSFDYIKVDADAAKDPNDLSGEVPRYYTTPYYKFYAPGFERLSKSCDSSRRTTLNAKNTLWQYSGKSKATLHPWNHLSYNIATTGGLGEYLPAAWLLLFPTVKQLKAVRCAPTCCMPTAFNSKHKLLAAYYSGSRQKDDRPITAVEQEDKEACAASFAGALEVGNIPLIRRYRPVVGALKPEHAVVLAGNGHLEALKWARNEGVEFPPNICVAAVSSGKLDVLKYCIENGAICDDDLMLYAMMSGSFECVEYCLETLKLPWVSRTITVASRISPGMVKYCLENGAPHDIEVVKEACKRTDLEVVAVLAESSHPFPTTPDKIELGLYEKRKHVCDSIERICASRGYSLKYSQSISDSY